MTWGDDKNDDDFLVNYPFKSNIIPHAQSKNLAWMKSVVVLNGNAYLCASKFGPVRGGRQGKEEITILCRWEGYPAPTASSVDRLKDASVSCVPCPGSWRWGFGLLVASILSLSKRPDLSPTLVTLNWWVRRPWWGTPVKEHSKHGGDASQRTWRSHILSLTLTCLASIRTCHTHH